MDLVLGLLASSTGMSTQSIKHGNKQGMSEKAIKNVSSYYYWKCKKNKTDIIPIYCLLFLLVLSELTIRELCTWRLLVNQRGVEHTQLHDTLYFFSC